MPSTACRAPASLRIVSPVDGDVYRVPPGVDASYATVALRAVGAGEVTRWTVDDRPVRGARLALTRGEHVIRAQMGTASDEVRIVVE